MEKHNSTKTLFVRNLPFSATNEAIEGIFSDVGPIKRCFVVKDKEAGKCRGFGYVTYSLKEDADKALETLFRLEGRKLHVDYAKQKEREKKRKKKEKSEVKDDIDSVDTKEDNSEAKSNPETKLTVTEEASPIPERKKSVTKQKQIAASTVVLTQMGEGTTLKDVKKAAKSLKQASEVAFPVPDRQNTAAFLQFSSKADAAGAIKTIKTSKLKIKGSPVRATLLSVEMAMSSQKQLKRGRLIIRNLSFKCTEQSLKEAFSKCGQITEVTIPKYPDGKMRGFGFVQFDQLPHAAKAVQQLNGKPILGRPVAVDWAVAKDRYREAGGGDKVAPKVEEPKPDDSDNESDEGSFSADSGDDNKAGAKQVETGDKSSDSDSDGSSDEDEEDDDSEQDNNESANSESDEESEMDEDENSDSDSEGEDEGFSGDSDSDESPTKRKKGKEFSDKSDVDEGKTLFVRNISFDTEEEKLKEYLAKQGPLNYCRLVIDPETEHSRGSAFIQFKKKEDADACMEAASEDNKDGGLELDGRKLNVVLAVRKDAARKLIKDKKEKEPKDSRNLYLAREGLIRPGTQAAQGLTKIDLDKRMKVEGVKRQKLKNPNIFISPTRLCIRNLPTKIDDLQLKKIMIKAAGDKSVRVSECRIMRDLQQVNAKGVAKSRGFGFVAFTEHTHALEALRATNNNPDLFGESKRPIVEFSLENRAALALQEKRRERAELKKAAFKKDNLKAAQQNIQKRQKQKKQELKTQSKQVGFDATTNEKKQGAKGLPSHWGPKVRHKPRPQPPTAKKPQDKSSRKTIRQEKRPGDTAGLTEPPKKKQKKKKNNKGSGREKTDNLDSLVNKYRNTLTAAIKKNKAAGPRSKWFQ